MNEFFTKTRCDRCGKPLNTRILSMFNNDVICMECKQNETTLQEYPAAVNAENEAIKNGNANFEGIGLPAKKE